MTFEEFIQALNDAGWRDTCDAQHAGAFALWNKIFSSREPECDDGQNKNKTKKKNIKAVHFDTGRSINMPISGRHSICACGTSFQDSNTIDGDRYTRSIEHVTCKNCLRICNNKKELFIKQSV